MKKPSRRLEEGTKKVNNLADSRKPCRNLTRKSIQHLEHTMHLWSSLHFDGNLECTFEVIALQYI